MRACLWTTKGSYVWIDVEGAIPPDTVQLDGTTYQFHRQFQANEHSYRRYVEVNSGEKIYTVLGPDTEAEIEVAEDEMIVYDVCKVKEYEGGDYVPRKAKTMPYHMLKEMHYNEDV